MCVDGCLLIDKKFHTELRFEAVLSQDCYRMSNLLYSGRMSSKRPLASERE